MKMQGRIVALAACLAASLATAGCGKKDAATSSGAPSTPGAGTGAGVAGGQPPAWRVANVVAAEVPEYSEPINPLQEFRLAPVAGERLVRIDFELEVGSADAGAVEGLAQARRRIDASIPQESSLRGLFIFTLPDDVRAALRGEYRLFDSAQFVLVDGAGGRHVAVWCIRPDRGDLSVYWANGALDTCVDGEDPEGWHGLVRSEKTAVGLLEPNRKEEVSLLYRLPAGPPAGQLRLDIAGVGALPVR
jgi:hypothetical protein